MAGAGKTSVGKALSLELGYEFLDTDKIIEISYGKSKDIIAVSYTHLTLPTSDLV